MYENIKVIALDIDLTITNTKHELTPKTVEAIEKLRDAGYLVGLASGRPLDDIDVKYIDWGIRKQFDFLIGWNGCQLYDDETKKSYEYNFIKKEELKEIIEFMSEFDTTVNMYEPKSYLSNKQTDEAWLSAFRNKRKFEYVTDISRFYQHDNGGIMFRTTVELMPAIEKKIAEELKGKDYIGFKTQANLMEFAHKDCTKGYVLKKYAELKNIPLDDCMAFGDTTNDNVMLEVCHGICLLNGSDDTKAVAERITEYDCDHDGFARFVNKYLLKEEE